MEIELGHSEQGLGEERPQGKGLFWKFCTEMLLEETEQTEGLTLGSTEQLQQVAGERELECYQEGKPRLVGQTWT